MTIADFVRDLDSEARTLTVLNRTEPDPVYELLRDVFAGPEVAVEEAEAGPVEGAMDDVVLLRKGGEVVASSMLADVRDTVLLVNSDIYVTGSRSLAQVDTPDVVARLDDTRLFATGYPSVKKQKMLLIEMSRYIERQAWNVGGGDLHSGFQRLSRIDDESGTHEAYADLAATDLTVHAYGVPDWEPDVPVVDHGADTDDMRRSWFVAFDPPRDEERKVALIAYKPTLGENQWRAFWTYDGDRVDALIDYLGERYPGARTDPVVT